MKNKYIYIVQEYTDRDDYRITTLGYYSSVEKAIDCIVKCYTLLKAYLKEWGNSDVTALTIARIELDNEEDSIREYGLYNKLHSYDPLVSEQPSEWDRLREENPDEK